FLWRPIAHLQPFEALDVFLRYLVVGEKEVQPFGTQGQLGRAVERGEKAQPRQAYASFFLELAECGRARLFITLAPPAGNGPAPVTGWRDIVVALLQQHTPVRVEEDYAAAFVHRRPASHPGRGRSNEGRRGFER